MGRLKSSTRTPLAAWQKRSLSAVVRTYAIQRHGAVSLRAEALRRAGHGLPRPSTGDREGEGKQALTGGKWGKRKAPAVAPRDLETQLQARRGGHLPRRVVLEVTHAHLWAAAGGKQAATFSVQQATESGGRDNAGMHPSVHKQYAQLQVGADWMRVIKNEGRWSEKSVFALIFPNAPSAALQVERAVMKMYFAMRRRTPAMLQGQEEAQREKAFASTWEGSRPPPSVGHPARRRRQPPCDRAGGRTTVRVWAACLECGVAAL